MHNHSKYFRRTKLYGIELEIFVYQGTEKTKKRSDISVVIDVIRAFSVSKVLFDKGVKKILLATDAEDAFQIKKQRKTPKLLLAGERFGVMIPGFDLDNSPYIIDKTDLDGCEELIQMTTNGTKATLNAKASDLVLVTGMTNAFATAQFIRSELSQWEKTDNPIITFVASHPESDEDVACAEFMIELLHNLNTDPSPYISRVRSAKVAEKFLDPENHDFQIEDLSFSARVEHSDYVMQVTFNENESFITKRMISNDIS